MPFTGIVGPVYTGAAPMQFFIAIRNQKAAPVYIPAQLLENDIGSILFHEITERTLIEAFIENRMAALLQRSTENAELLLQLK